MFFQYRPLSLPGGDMSWGHAVSKDLIHWKQLPEAITGDAMGAIWSGSAVIDFTNTSGLGSHNDPPMVCFYTAAGGYNAASTGQPFTQCMAYSLDGYSFPKYDHNPVIPHIINGDRDPKVVWYEPTHSWILALYLDGNDYGLFGSKNLLNWHHLSDVKVPNAGECPDFFPMNLNGKKSEQKWIFWTAPGLYEVGQFDGTKFTPETSPIPSYFVNTAYAAQTFSDAPHGRRIQISWYRGAEFPGAKWDQQMSIPCELHLVTTDNGPRLTFNPVSEVTHLHGEKLAPETTHNEITFSNQTGLYDFEGTFSVPSGSDFSIKVHGETLTYSSNDETLAIAGSSVKVPLLKGKMQLRILVDRASIEIFAQHGLVYLPIYHLIPAGPDSIVIDTQTGCRADQVGVYAMHSAW